MADDDFASVIERAQQSPRSRADIPQEVTDLFEKPIPPNHRVIREGKGDQIPGMIEYDYQAHIKYFAIPERADEYEAITNDILAGKALLRWEKTTFTKEGDFIVVVCYMTMTPNKERTEKKQKELVEQMRKEEMR
jgi:hypothetical protein